MIKCLCAPKNRSPPHCGVPFTCFDIYPHFRNEGYPFDSHKMILDKCSSVVTKRIFTEKEKAL